MKGGRGEGEGGREVEKERQGDGGKEEGREGEEKFMY